MSAPQVGAACLTCEPWAVPGLRLCLPPGAPSGMVSGWLRAISFLSEDCVTHKLLPRGLCPWCSLPLWPTSHTLTPRVVGAWGGVQGAWHLGGGAPGAGPNTSGEGGRAVCKGVPGPCRRERASQVTGLEPTWV